MSEPIEKEGAFSAIISTSAAWTSLGAGISLLILALFAVLVVIESGAKSQEFEYRLRGALGPDLAGARINTVKPSEDGTALEMSAKSAKGALETFRYEWTKEDGKLVRIAPGSEKGELIGQAENLSFRLRDNVLEVRAKKSGGHTREVWALARWCLP